MNAGRPSEPEGARQSTLASLRTYRAEQGQRLPAKLRASLERAIAALASGRSAPETELTIRELVTWELESAQRAWAAAEVPVAEQVRAVAAQGLAVLRGTGTLKELDAAERRARSASPKASDLESFKVGQRFTRPLS